MVEFGAVHGLLSGRDAQRGVARQGELLFEQEILRDDRAHSAGATELCGRDDEVEQSDHNSRHTRASVGHTADKAQPRSRPGFTGELGIRDAQAVGKDTCVV